MPTGHFNDLPRGVRERLVQLTAKGNEKDPRVLAAEPDWSGAWFRWLMLVASLGVMGFCVFYLFTRFKEGIHPRHDEEAFLGLAAGVFVFGVAAGGTLIRRLWPRPPYRGGLWAFPSGLLKLDGGSYHFRPMAELPRPTLVTVRRNGRYSSSRLEFGFPFNFTFWEKAEAEQKTERILAAKQRMAQLLATNDEASIRAVDPLAECTLSGQWAVPAAMNTEGPRAAVVPGAVRLAQWLGSLALGVVVAIGSYALLSVLHTPRF